MKNPVEFFKWIRKRKYIQQSYSGKYAFVGIGNHSTHNLYPILAYLNTTLKYIVTRSEQTSDFVNQNRASVIATTDYERVLNDPDINGIFICANPKDHYQLAKMALLSGKNVFVEKPLCLSSHELADITNTVNNTGKICLVGLQRRYSTCSGILQKKLKKENTISYNYKFLLGGYPEGNIFWDIFIHPIDLIYFLFGEYELISFQKTDQGRGQCTVLMQTKHKDVIGTVEMSTQYSWNHPKEELSINTSKGVYLMENQQQLTYMPKPSNIMSIPLDKVMNTVPQKHYLFDTNNFLPVFPNNQLVSQGYFEEIKTFLDLCENKKSLNRSAPDTLTHTYSIIETLIN